MDIFGCGVVLGRGDPVHISEVCVGGGCLEMGFSVVIGVLFAILWGG